MTPTKPIVLDDDYYFEEPNLLGMQGSIHVLSDWVPEDYQDETDEWAPVVKRKIGFY